MAVEYLPRTKSAVFRKGYRNCGNCTLSIGLVRIFYSKLLVVSVNNYVKDKMAVNKFIEMWHDLLGILNMKDMDSEWTFRAMRNRLEHDKTMLTVGHAALESKLEAKQANLIDAKRQYNSQPNSATERAVQNALAELEELETSIEDYRMKIKEVKNKEGKLLIAMASPWMDPRIWMQLNMPKFYEEEIGQTHVAMSRSGPLEVLSAPPTPGLPAERRAAVEGLTALATTALTTSLAAYVTVDILKRAVAAHNAECLNTVYMPTQPAIRMVPPLVTMQAAAHRRSVPPAVTNYNRCRQSNSLSPINAFQSGGGGGGGTGPRVFF